MHKAQADDLAHAIRKEVIEEVLVEVRKQDASDTYYVFVAGTIQRSFRSYHEWATFVDITLLRRGKRNVE